MFFVFVIGVFFGNVVMFMVMYFEWLLYVMFIGLVFVGFFGFLLIFFLVVMVYIVDIIEKNEVVFWFGKENVYE